MSADPVASPTSGPLLQAFDAIAAAGGDPQAVALKQLAYLRLQIETNALPFFAELRAFRPILVTPMLAIVSQFRDVEEILHRETVFSVQWYAPHMTGVIGPFILSLDITPAYDHDKAAMQLAVRREDLDRITAITAKVAGQAVAAGVASGKPFDIVQTLTRQTPVRLAAEYYGFAAPDDATMMGWARACFFEFFENLDNDPQARQLAVEGGAAMAARARAVIAARRTLPREHRPDDVLSRLLNQQIEGASLGFDDEGVVRTLMGLVVGMIETTSQAAVQALLVLFAQPAALAGAAAAALADDDALLWAYIQEALRFQPVNPLVIRILAQDYLLAAGTSHATTLPKGLLVFAGTWSAMFDDQVVALPERFDVTRPASNYLHFATGEHACFGRYISQAQLTQILKPLLKLKGLTAAAAPVYAGTFPEQLLVAVAG